MHVSMWVFSCGVVKWTGRGSFRAGMKNAKKKAVWERRAKSTEKSCSKWGVPGPAVPLIKMLTLCGGSSISSVLLVPSLAADVTFHLSAHEPTPVLPAMVNGVWGACVCVCLVARGHCMTFQSTEWGYFPKAVLFESLRASLNIIDVVKMAFD